MITITVCCQYCGSKDVVRNGHASKLEKRSLGAKAASSFCLASGKLCRPRKKQQPDCPR
jgi:hypothetical protein